MPGGAWRDEFLYAELEVNHSFSPQQPPPRLVGDRFAKRNVFLASNRFGKERAAVDGDRLVLFNKWPKLWTGAFGRGSFKSSAPVPSPPPLEAAPRAEEPQR
eukprot:3542715-Prymnesium_polylepis.1